jgi:hypothetical protein
MDVETNLSQDLLIVPEQLRKTEPNTHIPRAIEMW